MIRSRGLDGTTDRQGPPAEFVGTGIETTPQTRRAGQGMREFETMVATLSKGRPRADAAKRLAGAGGVLMLACAFVAGASATTLEEAVGKAISTNPQVLGSGHAARAAGFDVKRARGGYFPSLDVDAGYGAEHTDIKQLNATGGGVGTLGRRELGVTARQMLWDGWATRSEIERRVALLNAAQNSLEDTREAIAFRTVQAYLDVARARELLKLAGDNVVAHENVLTNVAAKAKGGVGNQADVEQATARLAFAKSTVLAREGDLREARAHYEAVVGEVPGDLATPARKPSGLVADGTFDSGKVSTAIGDAMSVAADGHPSIRASKASAEAAASEIKLAKSAYHPQVDLEAAMRRDDDIAGVRGYRDTESLMLVTRWNLFRGGADRAQEQAAVARKLEADETVADTQRRVAQNVEIAYQARAVSESRLSHLKNYADSSAGTLRAYRAQFELNRRTLLDVLNAENELFNAKSNLAGGLYEDLVNQYFVEASKGNLINSLGVASSQP